MMAVSLLLLLAQVAATGSVVGTLRDLATGEPLAGALVTIVDIDRSTVSDANGSYRLERLPSGTHRLLARRIGYAPRTLEALVPPEGSVEITIALRAEPITLGAVAGVDSEVPSPSPDRRVDVASLRDHPLLAEPDVLQALSGGAVAMQPESPSGIHVRGGASDQVEYLLDGIPVFNPYHSGEAFSAWNPDALAGVELTPASESWDALSGVVAAATRAPGDRHHAQTGFSTTQMRATVDGPLGSRGAGYLLSQRSAFPGFPAPQHESTYLRGETGDWLAKVEAPLHTGLLRLLGYQSGSELDAASTGSTRNTFAWSSRSIGGEWTKLSAAGSWRARLWSAQGNSDAIWHTSDSTAERLTARRADVGTSVTLDRAGPTGRTTIGFRIQTSRMTYRLAGSDSSHVVYDSDAPLAGLFAERSQKFGPHVELQSTLSAMASAGTTRFSPRTWLSWSPVRGFMLSGGYARLHQFSQSLRNPESVAGAVFPVDLHVGAARAGVPIARSDQGIVAAEYRPEAGLRLAMQGYIRAFRDLVLVAPGSTDPFATGSFVVGSGSARGFAVEVDKREEHYSLVASYARQHVRFNYGRLSYVPDYAATHAIDAGIIVHPSHTLSLRLGASGRFGRRVTSLTTPFEWESCNVADRGCEFVGTPRANTDSLGATRLPGYLRLDFGVRTRWHVRLAGRTTEMALFGTLTNIFGRANVLTTAPDPNVGTRVPITMRPRTPLVVGVDWTF